MADHSLAVRLARATAAGSGRRARWKCRCMRRGSGKSGQIGRPRDGPPDPMYGRAAHQWPRAGFGAMV